LTGCNNKTDTDSGCCYYRAAEYLVRTGPTATLEVAKQGAIYHGLATLLQQPSPVMGRGKANHMTCYWFVSGFTFSNITSLAFTSYGKR